MAGEPLDVPGLLGWVSLECNRRGVQWLEPRCACLLGEVIAKHGTAADVRACVTALIDERAAVVDVLSPPPIRRAAPIPDGWEVVPHLFRPAR